MALSLKPAQLSRYKDIARLFFRYGRGDLIKGADFDEEAGNGHGYPGEMPEAVDLAHDLAAGGLRIKALPQEAPEGAPRGVDAIAAVLFGRILGEQARWQAASESIFELAQGQGAHGFEGLGGARAQGSQGGAQSGEERCIHVQYYYWTND